MNFRFTANSPLPLPSLPLPSPPLPSPPLPSPPLPSPPLPSPLLPSIPSPPLPSPPLLHFTPVSFRLTDRGECGEVYRDTAMDMLGAATVPTPVAANVHMSARSEMFTKECLLTFTLKPCPAKWAPFSILGSVALFWIQCSVWFVQILAGTIRFCLCCV